VLSDFRMIGNQEERFGLLASVPTVRRTLDEIACGREQALAEIIAAVNTARRRAWVRSATRHGAIPASASRTRYQIARPASD
jgi:hypothetical protein